MDYVARRDSAEWALMERAAAAVAVAAATTGGGWGDFGKAVGRILIYLKVATVSSKRP